MFSSASGGTGSLLSSWQASAGSNSAASLPTQAQRQQQQQPAHSLHHPQHHPQHHPPSQHSQQQHSTSSVGLSSRPSARGVALHDSAATVDAAELRAVLCSLAGLQRPSAATMRTLRWRAHEQRLRVIADTVRLRLCGVWCVWCVVCVVWGVRVRPR